VFRLLIPVIVLIAIILFVKAYNSGSPQRRKKLVFGFLFSVLFAGVLFLTLTGRLHYVAAVVTGLIPFARRIYPLLRYVPVLRRFVSERRKGKQDKDESGDELKKATITTRDDALKVLGLAEGASKQEIVDAHRKLMQKCHPDRGGNDFLAAQLNQAKDILLS